MAQRRIDLRSDTVTKPSRGMRKAMASAEVGDDVLGDDPTVIALEKRMAGLLGKEAAVYVPSGTMANALAVLSQTKPGDEMIVNRDCHVFNYEAGSASTLAGVQLLTLEGEGGVLPVDKLPEAVRPVNVHHPRTSLISVENTHNRAGGRIYPFDQMEKVSSFAKSHGLRLHLDGARLANAHIATGISFSDYGKLVDSITFCFSKGLGAPIGSIFISDRSTVERARLWRKRLGGGMRQVGILAAACDYALDHNVERLAEDHKNAARIAEFIRPSKKVRLIGPVETNIIIIESIDDKVVVGELMEKLEDRGVFAISFGNRIRFVTHLDISSEDVEYFGEVLSEVLR
jgi:threonine aldolase